MQERRSRRDELKKLFIRITSRSVLVKSSPERSAVIKCVQTSGQILQVLEQQNFSDFSGDLLWYRVNAGWICSRDSSGFICSEPVGESEANTHWAEEFIKRQRLSSAISNMLIRSHSLDNARKCAKSIKLLTKRFLKEQHTLFNLPDINLDTLIISLQSSTKLKNDEIFEFVKIAASYQSEPFKALGQIADEIEKYMFMRPSEWVKGQMGIIETHDDARKNDRFVMTAGQNDMKKFQVYLDAGQDLTALHSELKYTALHAAADFGAEECLQWLVKSGLSLDLRDGRNGRTPLHFAAASGRTTIISILLEAGADRTIVDFQGLLPYQVADQYGYAEARELLKFVAPEIHHVAVVATTPFEITLTWMPPKLQEDIHSRIVEYGVMHEPVDFKRHGGGKMIIVPSNRIRVTDLDPATGHGFSVLSRSIAGWSKSSSKLIHFTLSYIPSTPAAVELMRVSINGLFITWFPSEFNNGARIDHYEIDLRPMTDVYEIEDTRNLETFDEVEDNEGFSNEEDGSTLVQPRTSLSGEAKRSSVSDRYRRLVRHTTVSDMGRFLIGLEPLLPYKLRIRAHNELGYSAWSEVLENVIPRDGVKVLEFGLDWADVEWFEPLLNVKMGRFVTAYELQMCIPTGPLQTSITLFNPDKIGRKNIQAIYDFKSLADDLKEPRYRVTGLSAGVRYQFRVRMQVNNEWLPWELGLLSEIITTPATSPEVPFNVLGFVKTEYTREQTEVKKTEVLDAGDDYVVIQWTNGKPNGSSITGFEVYAAHLRIHKEKDLKAAAKEADSSCQLEDIDVIVANDFDAAKSISALSLVDDTKRTRFKWQNITPLGEVLSGSQFRAKGLQNGSSYIFRVRQSNDFGWSPLSAASQPLTTAAVSEPEPPTLNFSASRYMVISCIPTDKYAAYSTTEYEIQSSICKKLSLATQNTDPPVWEYAIFRKYTFETFSFPSHEQCIDLVQYRREIEQKINKGSGLTCPDCGNTGEMDERNQVTHAQCMNCKLIYCYVCGIVDREASNAFVVSSSLFSKPISASEEILFIESLSSDTTYLFRMRFKTAIGWSPWSASSKPMRTLGMA